VKRRGDTLKGREHVEGSIEDGRASRLFDHDTYFMPLCIGPGGGVAQPPPLRIRLCSSLPMPLSA